MIFIQSYTSSTFSEPLRTKDFPLIGEWLSVNQQVAEKVAKGLRDCDKYYEPLVNVPSRFGSREQRRASGQQHAHGLTGDSSIGLFTTKQRLSRFLRARCMYRLAEGDSKGAWDDIMLLYRVSQRHPRYPTYVHRHSVSIAEGCARSVIGFAQQVRLGPKQAKELISQLDQLPPGPTYAEILDVFERYKVLAHVTKLARQGPSAMATISGKRYAPLVRSLEGVPVEAFDWNHLMKFANQHIDASIAAQRYSKYSQRSAASNAIRRELERKGANALNPAKIIAAIEASDSPGDGATSAVESWMAAGLLRPPAVWPEPSARMYMQFGKLALALSAYRGVRGAYPERLADLVPRFIEKIPPDEFADGKPLGYVRRNSGYIVYSVGWNADHRPIDERLVQFETGDGRRIVHFHREPTDVVMVSPEAQ